MNGEAGRCTKGAGGTRSDTGSTNLGAQYMSQMITQTEEAPPVPGNFTRHYTLGKTTQNIQINCFFTYLCSPGFKSIILISRTFCGPCPWPIPVPFLLRLLLKIKLNSERLSLKVMD